MRTSGIADTYARSLFELASLTDSVVDAEAQLGEVVRAVRGYADLRDALGSPSVPADKKREILREIFGEIVQPPVLAIVTVVIEAGHVDALTDVAAAFTALVEDQLGVVPASVVTAVPLSDALRAQVAEKLSASLGKRVVLRETVDPAILGGIVINVAGRVLDGSLLKQLNGVRQALATATSGGEA
jgi:F-type H+-transporting ATPase subunit delta